MGLEIRVNSIEEMCDLMCGNQIPKQKEESKMKYECRNSLTGNVSRSYQTYEEAHEHAYRFDEEVWEVSEAGEHRIY